MSDKREVFANLMAELIKEDEFRELGFELDSRDREVVKKVVAELLNNDIRFELHCPMKNEIYIKIVPWYLEGDDE